MMNLQEARQKFPQYKDLSDEQLANGLHRKYYADVPVEQFHKAIGYQPEEEAPAVADDAPSPAMRTMENIGQVYPVLEAGANVVTNLYGMPASGVAGIASLPLGLDKARENMEKVSEALVYQPKTERGQELTETLMYPFEKLQQGAGWVGEKTLEKTDSPILATAAHTAVEALPIWIGLMRQAPKAVEKIKNSNLYRQATIKERGLVVQSLEEVLRNNPEMTEAELARRSNQHFEEILAKRNKGETVRGEGIVAPETPGEYPQTSMERLPDSPRGFTMRNSEDVYSPYSPELAATIKTPQITQDAGGTLTHENAPELVSKEESARRLRKQKVESLSSALAKMKEDMSGGDVGGVAFNEGGEAQRYKSTNPEWMQKKTLEDYDKAQGTDLAKRVNKYSITNVLRKVEKGSPLTTKQEKVWSYIQEQAENLISTDNELAKAHDADTMQQKGFEPLYQKMAVGHLNPGDKVILNEGLASDEYEHKGYDENGNAILEDGQTYRLDPFEQVNVEGIKKGDAAVDTNRKLPLHVARATDAFSSAPFIDTSVVDRSGVKWRSGQSSFESRADHSALNRILNRPSDVVNSSPEIIEGKTKDAYPDNGSVNHEIQTSEPLPNQIRSPGPEGRRLGDRVQNDQDVIGEIQEQFRRHHNVNTFGDAQERFGDPGEPIDFSFYSKRDQISIFQGTKHLGLVPAAEGFEGRYSDLRNRGASHDEAVALSYLPDSEKPAQPTPEAADTPYHPQQPETQNTGEPVPSYVKGEGVSLYSGPVSAIYEELSKLVKKHNVKIPSKDMKLLEQIAGLPIWMADKYPELKPIQQVLDRRFRNYHTIKNTYIKELVDAWGPLDKKAKERLGKVLWRGDEKQAELGKSGLDKLSAEERQAYKTTREILNYIRLVDFPETMKILGVSEGEIQKYREGMGYIKGYMPHQREGRYYARVWDKEGNLVHREHFDDAAQTVSGGRIGAKSAIVRNKLAKQFPGHRVEIGENINAISEEAYLNIDVRATEELIKKAIDELDGEPNQKSDLQDAVMRLAAEMLKVRGFMSHGIERQGVPGFEKGNWQDSVLKYVSAWAGFKSKMIAAHELSGAWGKIDWQKKPELRKYADKQLRDTFSNLDAFDRTVDNTRATLFRMFLSGVVKSAWIQLSQNYIATIPRLTAETKWAGAKVSKSMGQAGMDILATLYGDPKKWGERRLKRMAARLTDEEMRGLTRARENGIIGTQTTDELMGRQLGKYGSVIHKADKALGFLFHSAEIFNRETAYIAAFRIAKEKGLPFEKAAQFAEDIIDQTHFRYGRFNLPPFARGGNAAKLARGSYAFRHYANNLFHLWGYLNRKGGAKGKAALIKSMAAILFFGGAMGFPFIKTLDGLYRKMFGKGMIDEIEDKAGDYADLALYGVHGLFGVDVSGSLGIDLPQGAWELLGAPKAFWDRSVDMIQDMETGDTQRAVEDFPLMPNAIKNPLVGYRYMTRGMETRSGKQKVKEDMEPLRINSVDFFKKSLGFQPAEIAREGRKEFSAKEDQAHWSGKRSTLVQKATKAFNIHGPDSKEYEKALAEIEEFNKKAPVLVPPIQPSTLKKAASPAYPSKRMRAYRDQ